MSVSPPISPIFPLTPPVLPERQREKHLLHLSPPKLHPPASPCPPAAGGGNNLGLPPLRAVFSAGRSPATDSTRSAPDWADGERHSGWRSPSGGDALGYATAGEPLVGPGA
jgi:hypothetical protein